MATLTQKRLDWPRLAGALLLCQLAGALGALATFPNLADWYAGLQKPAFNPPNGVFGPVWTTLYLLMGIALYRVWVSEVSEVEKRWAITWFLVQLALNTAWSFLFFGLHSPLPGLIDIVPLWLAILYTIRLFWPIDRVAGLLMLPYLAWVSFAVVLNFALWRLN